MKKTENINLGGIPFIIDTDAYDGLDHYLGAVERQFQYTDGHEEIVHDIEARIAELFLEKCKPSKIVSNHHVKEVIQIMGMPDELNGESIFGEQDKWNNQEFVTGKKLYRDTDDQIIAGVCSGVAAYYGINDPIWVRLFFVLFAITTGIGGLAYGILWFMAPKAITSSDKLQMRGEPININSIGNYIEQEVQNIADKITGFTSKKKVNRRRRKHSFFKKESFV